MRRNHAYGCRALHGRELIWLAQLCGVLCSSAGAFAWHMRSSGLVVRPPLKLAHIKFKG